MIQISGRERGIILQVFARHLPGMTVNAFGSRTFGKTKKWSDLDLAIMSESPVPPYTMMMLKIDLSESDLPWRVDLHDWSRLDPAFRRIIEQNMTPLQ